MHVVLFIFHIGSKLTCLPMEVWNHSIKPPSKETGVKLRYQKREVWSHRPSREFATVQGDGCEAAKVWIHRPSREFATVQGDSILSTVQSLAAERRSTVQRETLHRPKILFFLGAIICGIRRRSYMVKLSTERFLPGLSRVKILEQHVEYKLSKKGFSISSLWRDVGEGDGRWPPSKEKPPSDHVYADIMKYFFWHVNSTI